MWLHSTTLIDQPNIFHSTSPTDHLGPIKLSLISMWTPLVRSSSTSSLPVLLLSASSPLLTARACRQAALALAKQGCGYGAPGVGQTEAAGSGEMGRRRAPAGGGGLGRRQARAKAAGWGGEEPRRAAATRGRAV